MAGFDIQAFSRELQALERGAFRQVRELQIDLSAALTDKVYEMEGNAIVLLNKSLVNGVEVNSSAARFWIKLNERDSAPIPFCTIANQQDFAVISGTFRRFFVTLPAGAGAGAIAYLRILLGVSLSSTGLAGGPSGGGGYMIVGGGVG